MEFNTSKGLPGKAKIDVLGFILSKDKDCIKNILNFFQEPLKKEILSLSKRLKFSGKENQTIVIQSGGHIYSFLVVISGIGVSKKSKFSLLENIRETSANFVNISNKYKAKSLGVFILDDLWNSLGKKDTAEAVVEGAVLGEYKFLKYKSKKLDQKGNVSNVYIFKKGKDVEEGIKKGNIKSSGVIFARDLVNESPGEMTPKNILREALRVSKESPLITIKYLNKDNLTKRGFGGILAVSQGSVHSPYLIHLMYRPKNPDKKVAIVGKGITFDSGGLSLKPWDYMQNMKCDMAGAAGVLGVFKVLQKLNLNIEVHGVIGTCENMISATSIKPGDVIKTKSGKTVEIINTDAEGRIVLADALYYIKEKGVDLIIDLATLTGACIVALGDDIAGVMGSNKNLINGILEASRITGEKMWHLPLPRRYKSTIKSDIADIRNISKMKGGGAITAGLFLKEFVGNTPWAHIDIAGPAWFEKDYNKYIKKGGSGFGVRTIIKYLESLNA